MEVYTLRIAAMGNLQSAIFRNSVRLEKTLQVITASHKKTAAMVIPLNNSDPIFLPAEFLICSKNCE